MQIHVMVSTSRGKRKHNSPRAAFFSALMTRLAGDKGNTISQHFFDGDVEKFKTEMDSVVNSIVSKMKAKK